MSDIGLYLSPYCSDVQKGEGGGVGATAPGINFQEGIHLKSDSLY